MLKEFRKVTRNPKGNEVMKGILLGFVWFGQEAKRLRWEKMIFG
jgi:hypothetical protein